MSEPSRFIEARNLHRTYVQGEIEVEALRGVDLALEKGEFTSLAGPSGSGKTTLLNMIGCLDEPTDGEVWIDGRNVTALSRGEAADFRLAGVGFVFQAYNLVPVLTAYENAEFMLYLQDVPREQRRERVVPMLEQVGLGDMLDRRPNELSGGQQQRVAVVRALAAQPKVILADEPTANLDAESSTDLMDLMLELNREYETTFLFSTHDELVMERARRVVRLRSGRVEADERDEAVTPSP